MHTPSTVQTPTESSPRGRWRSAAFAAGVLLATTSLAACGGENNPVLGAAPDETLPRVTAAPRPEPTRRVIDEPSFAGGRFVDSVLGGFGGDASITTSIDYSESNDVTSAIWAFESIIAGTYDVECHIPTDWGLATTEYTIHLDGGFVFDVEIDQSHYEGEWVRLDTLRIDEGSDLTIKLGDRSADGSGWEIAFDACAITP